MTVDCAVVGDDDGVRVELSGTLRLTDVGPLRLRLLKCLAEQPGALLVEMSGLTVAEPPALSVFLAVSRQAGRWPGIPFLLCAPSAGTGEMLTGAALQRIPTFPTVRAARAHVAVTARVAPMVGEELFPIAGAPRHARNVVTEACLRWDLPHLVGPASLIVSELVSNVIDHAGTMATLQISLLPHCLTLSVRDGSSDEPVIRRSPARNVASGRGLVLVESMAYRWGWLPSHGGKVVWASLMR